MRLRRPHINRVLHESPVALAESLAELSDRLQVARALPTRGLGEERLRRLLEPCVHAMVQLLQDRHGGGLGAIENLLHELRCALLVVLRHGEACLRLGHRATRHPVG